MPTEVAMASPAKINLFLEIVGKRPDGFHDIDTVMSTISLQDHLWFKAREDGQIQLKVTADHRLAPGLTSGFAKTSENLVFRAAKLLQERTGHTSGVSICLFKRIPWEAGLGGASGNAATTLIALNQLWNTKLELGELAQVGELLGSDIPFFFHGGFARCTGRGETVEPLSGRPRLHLVVCKPPIGCSTAQVYQNCQVSSTLESPVGLIHKLNQGELRSSASSMRNRLQTFARPVFDWLERLNVEFENVGSLGHQMTGSGSGFFGVFPSGRMANRAARTLRARLPQCFVAQTATR